MEDQALRVLRTSIFERFTITYDYRPSGVVAITTPEGAEHLLWRTEDHVVIEHGNGTSEALVFDPTPSAR